MKNTIRNTVNEVYNTDLKNIKKTSPNQLLNTFKVENAVKSSSNNNKSVLQNNNNNGYNNYISVGSSTTSNSNGEWVLPFFLLIFIIILIGLAYYYRKEIRLMFDKLFKHEDKSDLVSKEVINIKDNDEELKEITRVVEDKDKIIEKDKLVIKKDGKVIEEDKIIKETKKPQQQKAKMANKGLKSLYSKNQIVEKDDMFCYLGQDDDMRQCINVYKDEICTSGDIYNRIDDCLVPRE